MSQVKSEIVLRFYTAFSFSFSFTNDCYNSDGVLVSCFIVLQRISIQTVPRDLWMRIRSMSVSSAVQ